MFLFETIKESYSSNVNWFIIYISIIFGPFVILWFLSLLSIKYEKVEKFKKAVLIIPLVVFCYLIFKIATFGNPGGFENLGIMLYMFFIIDTIVQFLILLFFVKKLKRQRVINLSKPLKIAITLIITIAIISCIVIKLADVNEKYSLEWILEEDDYSDALIYNEKLYYLDNNDRLLSSNLDGTERAILIDKKIISIEMIANNEIYFLHFDNPENKNYSKYNLNSKKITTIYKTNIDYNSFTDILVASGNLSVYENRSDLVQYDNRPIFVYKNNKYETMSNKIIYFYKEMFDSGEDSVNIPTFYQEKDNSTICSLAIKDNKYYYALMDDNSSIIKKIKILDLKTKKLVNEIDFNIDNGVTSLYDDKSIVIISNDIYDYDKMYTIYKYEYSTNRITEVKKLNPDEIYYKKYLSNNKLVLQKENSIEVIDLNTSHNEEYSSKFCQVQSNKLYYLKDGKIETVEL